MKNPNKVFSVILLTIFFIFFGGYLFNLKMPIIGITVMILSVILCLNYLKSKTKN